MEEIKFLTEGKIVAGRWKIIKKLGEGGMGAVFKVEDKRRKNFMAAMKVESDISDGGVLKLEVHVLKELAPLKNVVRLIDSGQRDKYCFMVMTMLGVDLMHLKRLAGKPFSQSTILRIAMATLYAIKQIHEAGFTHRDIKPGNCVSGLVGGDMRCFYLIDYGMVRAFIQTDKHGTNSLRKPREGDQLFRGTPRYCSLNTHYRKEQGRVDDLWSWLFMLVELHVGLPWRRLTDEREILKVKESTKTEDLFRKCPNEFRNLYDYLNTLKFASRPDYFGMWSECFAGLKRAKGSFLDKFEWEPEAPPPDVQTALSISEKDLTEFKPTKRTVMGKKLYPYASAANFKENILKM
ncbi:unnamed protein product [Caenorhabditis auriculariae]|uniref:Protein kinase domain-containing protein n=1 Tax=Caenorhabditis auriculariae TaxID=2777116 RepID=A0A8S1HA45_9PELO|nr:unnamed protein product [Caenorhabditis auriculariae]